MFISPIQGNIPNSIFTYSINNVSSDNISCINLSATNASLVNLTTTTFSPVNVIATNIVAQIGNIQTLNVSILNGSYINASTIIAPLSNISTLNVSLINTSDINASEVDCVEVYATSGFYNNVYSTLVKTTTLNTELGNFSTINVCQFNTINISSNVLTVLNTANISSLSSKLINVSIINSSTSNIITSNISTINASTITATTINNTTLNSSTANISTINSKFIKILDNTTPAHNSIIERDVNQVKFLGKTYFSVDPSVDFNFYTNDGFGIPDLKITNIGSIVTVNHMSVNTALTAPTINASTITGNISNNLSAGAGISLNTVSGITTITNTGLVISPLSISIINASTINSEYINSSANNASLINTLKINFLDTGDVTHKSYISRTTNDCKFIAKSFPADPATNFTFRPSIADAARLTIFGSSDLVQITNLSVIGNLSASSITGNISNNLAAGYGINLSTVLGVTTITNSASVSSPLNISIINASTGNFSTLTANSITGMTYSTQYAFQVTGSTNNDQAISAGVVVNFNAIQTCVPNTAHFNTIQKRYVIQVSGLYQFGFKAFIQGLSADFRVGIFKNGGLIAMGGRYEAESETFSCIESCLVGDNIDMRGVTGAALFYMAATHTWFWGYLLEPANAVINATTTLNVSQISAGVGNFSTANISIMNVSQITAGIGNFSSANISALVSHTNTTDLFYLINNGNPALDPASIIKLNNQLSINGGSGNIYFSTDSIVKNMYYDGNLNVSSNANISTINVSTINATNISSIVVGSHSINNFYGGVTTSGSTNTSCAYPFNTIMYNNTNLLTRVTISMNAPAINTGIIVQKAGWYKIDVSVPVGNQTYTDRCTWQGEITKNGIGLNDNSYVYTRFNDYGFRGTLATSAVYLLAVTDYIWYKITVAKATGQGFTDDFVGLATYAGGMITFTYLGAA